MSQTTLDNFLIYPAISAAEMMAKQPTVSREPASSGVALTNNGTPVQFSRNVVETNSNSKSIGRDTLRARRADADAKERRRRFHDRHMLLDTIQRNKASTSSSKIKPHGIPNERVAQMFRMFGAKMWPRSEADWARYDRDRDQAVKEIMKARRHRGFGLFNLEDYLACAKTGKQPTIDQPVRKDVLQGNKMQNRRPDSEARAIEPLRFDDSSIQAIKEIEEGPLTFSASFKRALESDNDNDESKDTKRLRHDTPKTDPRVTQVAYPEHFSRCSRGCRSLKTLVKLVEWKQDGRKHAMSIDRENEVRTLLSYSRMKKLVKAGEVDIKREVQLQEAAMVEIESAIDRLQCLESIDRSKKRRRRAPKRRDSSRHEMIDSWLPASRNKEEI